MKIRHTKFSNETGRRAYWFSDDEGKTWSLTLGWLEGRAPRNPNYRPTITGLTEEEAEKRAAEWIAGKPLAVVRFGATA